jgi:hypothetical protein
MFSIVQEIISYSYSLLSISFVDKWNSMIFLLFHVHTTCRDNFVFKACLFFPPGWRVGFTILNWRKTEKKQEMAQLQNKTPAYQIRWELLHIPCIVECLILETSTLLVNGRKQTGLMLGKYGFRPGRVLCRLLLHGAHPKDHPIKSYLKSTKCWWGYILTQIPTEYLKLTKEKL